MIISVASGNGGTGNTTVATNLAFSMGSNVQLLDCDVEEPNAHLFLDPEIYETKTVFTPIPEIDDTRCSGCGKCSDICRFNAIAIIAGTVLTFPEMCHSCGGCLAVCPEKAVKEIGRELGTVSRGRSGKIEFITGRLRIGEAMSPPLIRSVLTHLKADVVNIIDAPPGTSCPVIAATKNADFVLMVTEPTPFGLHDLKLGVEAVKILGIPCGLVINRSDIGNSDVIEYAETENLPILMDIPYDRRIAQAYSKGKLFVKEMPEWKARFLELYDRIEQIAKG
jgi:MinD superfamily P-loop ATPase